MSITPCSVSGLSAVVTTLSPSKLTLSSRLSIFSHVASSDGRPSHCTSTCLVVEESARVSKTERLLVWDDFLGRLEEVELLKY